MLPSWNISFTIARMVDAARLPRQFYNRPAVQVARDLLGKRLVRLEGQVRLSGTIFETEAYQGEDDLGCHCRAGRTNRTEVMYGLPGNAYVYFTYGKHWMLNFVVDDQNIPAAVLIRSIQPDEGIQIIRNRRGGQPYKLWTNGPAKICQALNIDKSFNGVDLCATDSVLFVENGNPIPDAAVTIGPRVGLNTVPEPWKSIPWRYLVEAT